MVAVLNTKGYGQGGPTGGDGPIPSVCTREDVATGPGTMRRAGRSAPLAAPAVRIFSTATGVPDQPDASKRGVYPWACG